MTMKYSTAKCVKSEGVSPFIAWQMYQIFHGWDDPRAETKNNISYGLTEKLEHISDKCHLAFIIE